MNAENIKSLMRLLGCMPAQIDWAEASPEYASVLASLPDDLVLPIAWRLKSMEATGNPFRPGSGGLLGIALDIADPVPTNRALFEEVLAIAAEPTEKAVPYEKDGEQRWRSVKIKRRSAHPIAEAAIEALGGIDQFRRKPEFQRPELRKDFDSAVSAVRLPYRERQIQRIDSEGQSAIKQIAQEREQLQITDKETR